MSNSGNPKAGYTPKEVAEILGISLQAVYRRIESGAIVGVKLHARRDCPDGCHCPIKIPLLPFGEYLSAVRSGG